MRHSKNKNRQRQRRTDPESSRHVAQFRVLFFGGADRSFGFERHTADWATARRILLDLRMHRARVDHLCPLLYFLWLDE